MQTEFSKRDVVPYKLFTRGNNTSGQVCRGNMEPEPQEEWFKIPDLPENTVIKHICCGYYFCIILTGYFKENINF